MKFSDIRSRLRAVFPRDGHFGTAVGSGALALLVSVSISHGLNRNLIDHFSAASELMARQRAVMAGHDRLLASMTALHAALLDSSARGVPGGPGVPERLAAFQRELAQMSAHLSANLSGNGNGNGNEAWPAAHREAVAELRAISARLEALEPGKLPLGAGASALPAQSLELLNRLVRIGGELRRQDDAEWAHQQASMVTLRASTQSLTYLLCFMFSLTVAMAAHWVQLARREARTRREADAARQEAVAAGELAAAASRDKSKFLGMLSHELLTPLQSIVSSMDLIESKGAVDVNDPVFMRLREGARALRARMSDLVDFAKMSAGRLATSPRKFRIDRLIEEVIAEHEEAVVRKDLDIHWEPSPELARPVTTDPRRVRQILGNLVSNAIKYTARGGVTIDASLRDGGASLQLEVRDTGVGIAPESIGHLFEPFYRVASASQMAEGSGLGLAVVHSLVELLHGRIEVESTFGVGTRFSVTLPLHVAPAPPAAAPQGLASQAAAHDAGSVLIVDDAHDARAVIADTVRSLGLRPTEAGTAGEALRALSERRYDTVLLDIELPDLSGFEVIRQVREGSGPNRDSHFVMLSASHESNHDAARLFNVRADKPIDVGQLKAALQDRR